MFTITCLPVNISVRYNLVFVLLFNTSLSFPRRPFRLGSLFTRFGHLAVEQRPYIADSSAPDANSLDN